MKNIIIILLILVIPVFAYLFMSKNSTGYIAEAGSNRNPSLIIYTSTMCIDCKKMKEVIKEIENDYSDKINFVSINALDNDRKIQDSVRMHDVKVVPTLVFTNSEGEFIEKVEGYIPKEELTVKIEEAINE